MRDVKKTQWGWFVSPMSFLRKCRLGVSLAYMKVILSQHEIHSYTLHTSAEGGQKHSTGFTLAFWLKLNSLALDHLWSLPGKNKLISKKKRDLNSWCNLKKKKINQLLLSLEPSAELQCSRNSLDFHCSWWGKQQVGQASPLSPPSKKENRVGTFSWLWHSFFHGWGGIDFVSGWITSSEKLAFCFFLRSLSFQWNCGSSLFFKLGTSKFCSPLKCLI